MCSSRSRTSHFQIRTLFAVCLFLSVGVYLLPTTVAEEPNIGESPAYSSQFIYPLANPSLSNYSELPNSSKFHPCNCVLYAKYILGITESLGVAGHIQPTRLTPYIGSLVITSEGSMGHVAIVTNIKDGLLYLREANYVHCKITYDRTLAIDSSLILGYR